MHLATICSVVTFFAAFTNAYSLIPQGSTVQLNGVYYHVPPIAVGRISTVVRDWTNIQLVPITVVNSNSSSSISCEDIDNIKTDFLDRDDVFQEAFFQDVFVQYTNQNSKSLPNLSNCGNTNVLSSGNTSFPQGPYLLSQNGYAFRVYRLYSDIQGAFSETAIESSDNKGSYSVMTSMIPGQSLSVAVPSRLYFEKTANRPLSGVRIGIKDIFDIKGLKTSNGNRAWYHLYPAANATAVTVQRLIDAGAIIVGKMKTSQFANGETATGDWVDYHAPFNPRGDGYQDPSSSSAGPAAGLATYFWLDITLGSDTGGSIRSPSQVQGLYGNRPSHGLVSMDGAMPLSPEFDTPGLFARDPSLWATSAKILYDGNITMSNSYPSSILTVGFANSSNSELDRILLKFLEKLRQFLSAEVTPFNITTNWDRNRTVGLLQPTVNNTYEILSAKRQANLVRDRFYVDYAAAYNGRRPHVNPAALQRWALADSSPSTVDEAMANRTIFMDWFNNDVLPKDPVSCSSHLLVYVPRIPTAKYRDTYLKGPSPPSAFSTSRISVMSGTPDMVVPIGHLAYVSEVTKTTEYLPVTVDFMAARGCDGMLFSLVGELYQNGILEESLVGASNIVGGDVLL